MKQVPGILCVSIAALLGIGVVQLLMGYEASSPELFAAAIVDFGLAFGLLYGKKWAFWLALLLSLGGVAASFAGRLGDVLVVLSGNGVVVVPMLISRDHFFGKADPGGRIRVPISGAVGFLLGGLFVSIVMGYCGLRYLHMERTVLYEGAIKVQVITASNDLPAGKAVEVQDLEPKSVYKSAVGDSAYRVEDLAELKGKRLKYPVQKGEPIFHSHIETLPEQVN